MMIDTKFIEVLPHFQLETLPEERPTRPLQARVVRLAFDTLGRAFPKKAGQIAYHLFTRPRVRAVHRQSDEWLESARLFEVLYGKIILKGYEWGQGDKTVLLVHGWESRGTALRSFVPNLLAAGYRVVAFDGPAHGNSGGRQTHFMDFAGAIRAVLNRIGPVQGIIAHSFGGTTSVFAMSNWELGHIPERLVLIGVPSNTEKVVLDALDYMNVPAGARPYFFDMLRKKAGNFTFQHINVEDNLDRTGVGSVLVVHDKNDLAVPFESAERIMERCDRANLLVTQGMGHFKLMKHPKVVEMVVDFIDRRP